jgi:hypothetical protein
VLCFVSIGTVDDRFTQRDYDAQNYLVPRTENQPMRMSAFQVNKRRTWKWKNIFQLFMNVRTPDLRHQELVLRYVVVNTDGDGECHRL